MGDKEGRHTCPKGTVFFKQRTFLLRTPYELIIEFQSVYSSPMTGKLFRIHLRCKIIIISIYQRGQPYHQYKARSAKPTHPHVLCTKWTPKWTLYLKRIRHKSIFSNHNINLDKVIKDFYFIAVHQKYSISLFFCCNNIDLTLNLTSPDMRFNSEMATTKTKMN